MRHQRSLQDELLALVEAAARQEEAGLLGPRQALAAVRAAGVKSQGGAAQIVRAMRDARHVGGCR